ncbi:MAG: type II toxin-antitoxin system RelE/ParE family toxin [Pseudomonadota bacterium]
MKILQSKSFERKIKKFNKAQKQVMDRQIRHIVANPAIGIEKKGDLRGVLVHKFNLISTRYLLAYRLVGEDIELIMIGPHENYYRDLKSYLRDR